MNRFATDSLEQVRFEPLVPQTWRSFRVFDFRLARYSRSEEGTGGSRPVLSVRLTADPRIPNFDGSSEAICAFTKDHPTHDPQFAEERDFETSVPITKYVRFFRGKVRPEKVDRRGLELSAAS